MLFENKLVVVRGGGDLATGAVHKLVNCGFPVVVLEIAQPTVIRRTVALAEAVYQGEAQVENLRAVRAASVQEALDCLKNGLVPVLVDETADCVRKLKPAVLVDAILAKQNLGTTPDMAGVVVALGPGFCAGRDVHAVVETNRGHNLGKVFFDGEAEPDTGVPGVVGGQDYLRLLKAPCDGQIRVLREICGRVRQGEVVALVEGQPVCSGLDGVLRGMLTDGLRVRKGLKIGDVDPRCKPEFCYLISDKARAVGGGVLEAVLTLLNRRSNSIISI